MAVRIIATIEEEEICVMEEQEDQPEAHPASILFASDDCNTGSISVRVNASDRDADYLDELGKIIATSDGSTAIKLVLADDVNIPLVRPFNFKNVIIPGFEGIPKEHLRADLEIKYLSQEPMNVIALVPQTNGSRRSASFFERERNRWFTVEYDLAVRRPESSISRISDAYPRRGRGNYPWWKSGYPGEKTTGVG